jgi:3-deoxy-7-phosphoheptulonate synthase
MILQLKKNTDRKVLERLAQFYEAVVIENESAVLLVTPSKMKQVRPEDEVHFDKTWVCETDIQLSSKNYISKTRTVKIGDITLGGDSRECAVIIGPCGVESEELIEESAALIRELGLKTLRAGAYKPRTSPYTFRGLGVDGLKLLAKMRDKYGFSIITEVRDSTQVDDVIAYADVVQIGAKAMYDHGILGKCGKARKPILLKRGFGSTLQEFVQAAEFILSGGNEQVILCERGIRTFENKSRFTLDLCGVAFLKENTNLPIILDPSHAMGYAYGVPDLARACLAMDVEGLLIEVHPNPAIAKSDASQQLTHDQFRALYKTLQPIATAINRKLV